MEDTLGIQECDEKLGAILDQIEDDTSVFIHFDDGIAYFNYTRLKAKDLRTNPYLRDLHCTWKRKPQKTGWKGWDLVVDSPFDPKKYGNLSEEEQFQSLKWFINLTYFHQIQQIADAGDSELFDQLADVLHTLENKYRPTQGA